VSDRRPGRQGRRRSGANGSWTWGGQRLAWLGSDCLGDVRSTVRLAVATPSKEKPRTPARASACKPTRNDGKYQLLRTEDSAYGLRPSCHHERRVAIVSIPRVTNRRRKRAFGLQVRDCWRLSRGCDAPCTDGALVRSKKSEGTNREKRFMAMQVVWRDSTRIVDLVNAIARNCTCEFG